MMILGLSKKWIDKMKSLPESGMGYHNVAVKLKNGVVLKGMVTNSEISKIDISYPLFENDDIDEINLS